MNLEGENEGSDEEPINNEAGLDSGLVDLSIW